MAVPSLLLLQILTPFLILLLKLLAEQEVKVETRILLELLAELVLTVTAVVAVEVLVITDSHTQAA
jgi:hypothetical protein